MTTAHLHLLEDTREQAPPPFPPGVTVERVTLSEGDYTTKMLWDVARIERKSGEDFAASITAGRERLEREFDRLRRYPFRCVVVEADLSDFFEGRVRSAVHPNSVVGSVCSFHARWGIPTIFAHDAPTCGRVICGLLRRLEEEHVTNQPLKGDNQNGRISNHQ